MAVRTWVDGHQREGSWIVAEPPTVQPRSVDCTVSVLRTSSTSNLAADFQPVYTPDGASIVVRSQRRPGFEADRWYLDVYDRTTHAKRTVFTTPDLSVDDYRIIDAGKMIVFTAAEKATANIYVVAFGGGVPKKLASGGALGEVQYVNGVGVATRSTLTSPPEIVRVNDDGTIKALTNDNATWLALNSFLDTWSD